MKEFTIKVLPEQGNLTNAIEFIEKRLIECKTGSKDRAKAVLLAEEYLVELFKVTKENRSVIIRVKRFFGKTTVTLISESRNEVTAGTVNSILDLDCYESAPNAEAAIRSMIINANSDILRQSYRNGINKIVITAGISSQKNLMNVLFSMLLAVIVCSIMRFALSENICNAINDYVFMTIKTIFLNALKAVIAPLIFFSIAASVSSVTDLSELGKIGARVMGFYAMTTLAATIVAFTAYNIINPGTFNELSYMISETQQVGGQETVSILDTIIGIVPDNFIGAFVNSATLQLIFLGILVGGVVPLMGEKTEKITSFISAANDLFLRVASTITKCLPIAVFAFIGSMVMTMDFQLIMTLLSLFFCILLGMIVMLIFYLTVVFIMTGSNPFEFFKNAVPAWLNAFALSSSSAAMPFTMDTCDKKLNISPKLYSFSIPLGATINMDGFVVVLTISTLFLAKVFGVELSGGEIASLIVTIVLLSFGAPGIPGVSTICMSVLLMQFHVPMEALAIFIGIDAITDPLNTANNVFGDIVGTFCVGKRSGMMNGRH
ncbi:dicarboxylate/amino acid:cation symporter [Oribacterium sp. WCC10]|uniref:dicarboxylate/amino acid:cation symporter n=1 Tax=Oribacterium sp. WCC10 TaxID=1855343 RepID=UPI0008F2413A|nr:dicarboxylate/amino acid:cation symporter [Oribacterium sp. WCC10]SFG05887.1 Na+/H+-dicarboxylate symporter [Oribacterium sp. WCC10]